MQPPIVSTIKIQQLNTGLAAVPVTNQRVAIQNAVEKLAAQQRGSPAGGGDLMHLGYRAIAHADDHPGQARGLAGGAVGIAGGGRGIRVAVHHSQDAPGILGGGPVLGSQTKLAKSRLQISAGAVHLAPTHGNNQPTAFARVFGQGVGADSN